MSDAADWLEDQIARYVTGQSHSLASSVTPWVRLWITLPDEAGTGGTEVTGGAYAAKSSLGKWGSVSGGVVSASADITWAEATSDWGTITGVTIEDAASGGNMLIRKAVTPTAVTTGDTARIAAGAFTVTVT